MVTVPAGANFTLRWRSSPTWYVDTLTVDGKSRKAVGDNVTVTVNGPKTISIHWTR